MSEHRLKSEYYEPEPGEWITPVMNGYKMSCCDCGLTHSLNFQIFYDEKKETLRLRFQVFRDNRATAMIRRWRRKRGEHVPE